MIQQTRAQVTVASGIEGDFRGKSGKRQITVLSQKSWQEACRQIGRKLHWTGRRANLLVDDLELENSTGNRLIIGEVMLEISGETQPCYRMDEFAFGLQEALKPNWRGGVTCRVLKGGPIRVGDEVVMEDR